MISTADSTLALLIFSPYLPKLSSPEKDAECITEILSSLEGEHLKQSVLGGDLNSANTLWNSPHTCNRGEWIEDFAVLNNLRVANGKSNTPTFSSASGSSFPDAILISDRLAHRLVSWELLPQDEFGSDHKGAILTLSLKGKQIQTPEPKDWLKSVDKSRKSLLQKRNRQSSKGPP